MNQNFLVKKLIEVFHRKLKKKAFDDLRNTTNTRRRNTLRLHTMKSSKLNVMASHEDNSKYEIAAIQKSEGIISSTKINLKNSNNIGDKDTKLHTRPMKYGDIIYLSFDMVNKTGTSEKGIMMGKSLSGDKINAKYINSSIYDSSMKKCLFQILSKSEIKEEKIFDKNQLMGLLMSQNDDFADKLAKHKKHEHERQMSYTRNFGNFVLFGQSFALKHLHSNCYFSITHDELDIARNSLMINLKTKESDDCYLKFFPTSRIRNLGEVIRYGDYQHICKSSDKFVYVGALIDSNTNKLVLDASKHEFEWKINFFSCYEEFTANNNNVKASDTVQIYHSDYRGYLSLKNEDVKKKVVNQSYKFSGGTSNNYMKKNSIVFEKTAENKNDTYQVEFESTDNPSIFTYWEIKSENILDTSSLDPGKIIRLKNLVTGSYICVSAEGNNHLIVAKPYNDTLDSNLVLKQKISKHDDNSFNYDDLFKIKSDVTKNHIYITQLATSKKTLDKWTLYDDLLTFDASIDLVDRNKYGCKPAWGKNRNLACLFKFIPTNQTALFIYKLSSVKFFLNKFIKFLEVWGTRFINDTYYIDYETSITDLNQLEEAFNNFNSNIRQLFDELLLHKSDLSNKENKEKTEDDIKRQIGETLIDIGLIDVVIEIIKLIDFRIHKTCFKLVDYNDNTTGMKEFYKYKRLKNLINDKKFVELPQLVGKNIFNKIMVNSMTLLSAYGEVNENIKKRISDNCELFVNLIFFYEEECIEICKLIATPNKILPNENDKFCEYFLDKFFYSEDNIQARINMTRYYSILSHIISLYSYQSNEYLLNQIFNFFFKSDITIKFVYIDGRVNFYIVSSEADFERFVDKQKELCSFMVDITNRTGRYIDIVAIRPSMTFINSFLHSLLVLIKSFFNIPVLSKESTSICDYILEHVLSTSTAFEILHIQSNYQVRSVVLDLANHLLFYKQNVKNITDFLSNYSLLFFTDLQQKFARRAKPVEWINPPDVVKSLVAHSEKVVSSYLDFCSMMNKFTEIYTNKNDQELRFFKELLKFIQKCLNFGLFDFYQIKEIYEKILKFLHESIYDDKAKKKTTVMYLSILKAQLVFTNKNKKINEWVHLFYEVEYHCYEILQLINKFRLYYQINLLAKYSIKQRAKNTTQADLKIKCDYVFDILRFGPTKSETPVFVNLINQTKSSKKKSLFSSSNKIRSINDTTYLKIVERKGKTQATDINSLNYHFEVKFIEYYQKNYEKIKIYTIYWKDHFDFNEVRFFSKQMQTLKTIPAILLEIYSEYFSQREILYKVFKQSQFLLSKNIYMNHDIVESFVDSAEILVKVFRGNHDNPFIQEKIKEVKKGYLALNKQLVQSYHQKIFFTKFQNYLSCTNLLHVTVNILNVMKLADEDLLKMIFKFLQLMLKDNQTNQLFLLQNFQNFLYYLLDGHNTSKIIVHLLSSINNINEINKIIKYIFVTVDNILKDCDSMFDIFVTESSYDNKNSDRKIAINRIKLVQISSLNELLIMIINVKDNIKIDKLKRVIFLCLMNNKKLENLFSIYEPRSLKSYITSKADCAKELIGFFNSYYMIISDVLKDCSFAINTFRNIISSEKFIYFFKLNRGHYIFKASMLKIYSIVYLDRSADLAKYDYLNDVLEQIIAVDVKDYVYFINGIAEYQGSTLKKPIAGDLYKQLKIPKNDEFLQNKSKADERLLLNEIEYWGYLFTKSANQNYGLLYFTYDILKVLMGSRSLADTNDLSQISQTEQKFEYIKSILNEMKLIFEALKQVVLNVTDSFREFPVKDYLFLIDAILELIESISSGRNMTDIKQNIDNTNQNTPFAIKMVKDLQEKLIRNDERDNLNDTMLSTENNNTANIDHVKNIVTSIKTYILARKLDFYDFINGFIFMNQTSNIKQ